MAQAKLIASFPQFASFSPQDPDFRCISACTSKSYARCNNKLNPKDRGEATKLRSNITTAVADPQFDLDADRRTALGKYIELCCCKQVHRKRLDKAVRAKVVECWMLQISLMHPQQTKASSATSEKAPPPRERANVEDALAQTTSVLTTVKYRRPVTRSRAAHPALLSVNIVDPSTQHFLPHKTTTRDTLFSKIQCPLTHSQTKTGSLYIYTRTGDEQFVKIGYTAANCSNPVQKRLDNWQKSCRYIPRPLFCVDNVPNVKKVEQLVHYELMKYWRKEKFCRFNPECPTKHEEWFEVTLDTAKAVIERLVRWMREAEPYDEARELKTVWVGLCLKKSKMPAESTSQDLLDALNAHTLVAPDQQKASQEPSPGSESDELERQRRPLASPVHSSSLGPPPRLQDLARLALLISQLRQSLNALEGSFVQNQHCSRVSQSVLPPPRIAQLCN